MDRFLSCERLALTKIGPLFDGDNNRPPAVQNSLDEALRICGVLHAAGHVAFFAGGCVRDALLGRLPKDFDVATDATPDRVRKIFGHRNTLAFGASFGVIGVLPPKAIRRKSDSVHPTEVATFRSDGDYSDGRRPDRVHFGDARNDALRRDFTINGLFFDPLEDAIKDYVGGQEDLAMKCLRTIGLPEQRFDEDKLRMLRAVRFATSLGFEIESDTRAELIRRADAIEIVSGERIGAEMRRILSSVFAPRGLQLLIETGLAQKVLPQLCNADLSRLTELLSHRVSLDFETSLALVLLGLGGGEESVWATTLGDLAERWKLSGEEVRRVRTASELSKRLIHAEHLAWSQLQPLMVNRDIAVALQVAKSLVGADGSIGDRGVRRCEEVLQWSAEKLDPAPLVTGDRLIQEGFRPGPKFRDWLTKVRQKQLDGELTTEAAALEYIKRQASP